MRNRKISFLDTFKRKIANITDLSDILNDRKYQRHRIKFFTSNSKYSYDVVGFQIHTIHDLVEFEKDAASVLFYTISNMYTDTLRNKIFHNNRKNFIFRLKDIRIYQIASINVSYDGSLDAKKNIILRDMLY